MTIEVVMWPRLMPRARRVLDACVLGLRRGRRNPIITSAPKGSHVAITWGLGHPEGQRLIADARKTGRRVIGFDLGYWLRKDHFRVTFDHDHPQAIVMCRNHTWERWTRAGISLREDANPNGHVLLIGTGHKTAATYGEPSGDWEQRTGKDIRRKYPGRRYVFRSKPGGKNDAVPHGFIADTSATIEAALKGCALVVCRNSNVAVDAIIAGVPFSCEDGAAMAVVDKQPLARDVRMRFLHNLAHFQYTAAELQEPVIWDRIFGLMADG